LSSFLDLLQDTQPCENNSKSHSDGPTVCCLQTGESVHRDVYSCFPLGGLTVRSRRVHQVRTSWRLFVAFHDCTVLTYSHVAHVCSRMLLTYADLFTRQHKLTWSCSHVTHSLTIHSLSCWLARSLPHNPPLYRCLLYPSKAYNARALNF
jgi:hypothetical protein